MMIIAIFTNQVEMSAAIGPRLSKTLRIIHNTLFRKGLARCRNVALRRHSEKIYWNIMLNNFIDYLIMIDAVITN